MSDKVKRHYANELGRMAREAAELEISVTPKPGLVDISGPGCHDDMDYELFMKSSAALAPYWRLQASAGLNSLTGAVAMRELVSAGKEMEASMFAATNGVNTHKGLIFLLSLLLYGAGYCLSNGEEITAANISRFASLPVKGGSRRALLSLKDKPASELTHGERLLLEHGVTSIRGEAESGFPSVVKAGLPEFSRVKGGGGGVDGAGISSLLAIMEICEDSNVMHRGGYDFWNGEYKELVRGAREAYDPFSGDTSPIVELENKFKERWISPGGAADLLCCVIFLHKVINSPCQQ
ncbi:MAG: triphosphoribosyl-dephospho-CoA synthase [Synergistaceae bacterium]|nr:triphosphoribosyl-dephospho-CoA synthase [Synergistaceae bacterium]